MPTNLKSLLSRPRSRNELKFRDKEDNEGSVEEGGGNGVEGSERSQQHLSPECSRGHLSPTHLSVNYSNYEDGSPTASSGGRPTSKNFFSCSALPALGLVTSERDFCPSPDCCSTANYTNNEKCFGDSTISSSSSSSSSSEKKNNGSMRKCNTVLALSRLSSSPTFTTTASTPSSPIGPGGEFPASEEPGSLSASRVRMMRDRLYSASSSTLNNLINSSSGRTTKLLSGWKHPKNSPNGSSNGTFPVGVAGAASSCTKDIHDDNSHCSGGVTGGSSHGGGGGGGGGGTPGFISPFNSFFSGFKSRSQVSVVEGCTSSNTTFSVSTSPAMPVTPVNRLRRNFSAVNSANVLNYNSSNNLQVCGQCTRSSSFNSFRSWREEKPIEVFCRLCLSNFTMEETTQVQACSCRYCKDCLIAYVSFEIQEGAYEISCPDANCEKQGVLTLAEIEVLVPKSLVDKHSKFRLYREIEKDGQLTWCPSPGCETVCRIQEAPEKDLSGVRRSTITCTTCSKTFCADCKLNSHPDISCESHRRKLVKQGKLVVDESEIYSIKSIKKCPFCHVPIEKDSGCAQMMCKRCKHVFCWYCLTSLDDDFLLRHYDKGPCKNKLGHSRASVVWHRAQVIGIFAGFGILVLLASPLLILAAPCLLCCRCGYCANKLDPKDPVQL